MLRKVATTNLVALCTPIFVAIGQGLAGGAIEGRVQTSGGASIPNARISIVDSSSGRRQFTVAGGTGRFTFENVVIGGPYSLVATAIGYAPHTETGIVVHLGDRISRTVAMTPVAQPLQAVEITESTERDAGAGGPVHDVPGHAVRNLPLLKRDFVGLLLMAPQATQSTGSSNISIGGQHPRLNLIQVDGGTASDFLGLNATPGASIGARALSVEALDEIRILIAPFDVRQGGFTGGLINAVTRSGTNRAQRSAFVNYGGNQLVGPDSGGRPSERFDTWQYGASASGPILRDRLHYFAVADIQSQATPLAGAAIDDPAVGSSDSVARQVAQVASTQYGFSPGGPEFPVLHQPNFNAFGKLTWQAASTHLLALSVNASNASTEGLGRPGMRDGWQLSGSGFTTRVRNLTTRLTVNSRLGPITNELVAGASTSNTDIASALRAPVFLIGTAPGKSALAVGSTRNAQGTETDERIFELTDNVTWTRGEHTFTTGVQAQRLHIYDNLLIGRWGTWTFANVDSFAKGVAQRYDVSLPLGARPEGPVADYSPYQLAGYVQDRWFASSRLTLTLGARVDIPYVGEPAQNLALLANTALGPIDTRDLPAGNGVVSPRLGFSYDLGAKHDWLLRGGAGGFAGHPPYVYFNGAFSSTGQEQATLTCLTGVPTPTADVDHLPTQCLSGAGPSVGKPAVTVFDPSFRFQQAVKYDVGVDHSIRGIRLSLDVMYSTTRHTPFVRDLNLVAQGTNAEGRTMYGSIVSTSGAARPVRRDTLFGPIYRYENRTADRSTSATVEAGKTWGDALVQVGYTWSRSDDVMSMSGAGGAQTMTSNPLDGIMTDRRLRRSARDTPHNFVATAAVPLRGGVTAAALFRMRSGTPFAYVVSGDANADGVQVPVNGVSNDLAYVPRDSLDLSLSKPSDYSRLDSFIRSERCLATQRGAVMGRTSCRNPSVMSLDARVSRRFTIGATRRAELSVDIFNLANLLHRDWGLVRETAAAEGVPLLAITGYDVAMNRPRYAVLDQSRAHVIVDASRWRLQLGARIE
jgi:hypothetical protein